MDELKPCPFCEGEAEYGACQIDYPPQNCQTYIRCLNCKAEIHADGRISDIHKLKQRIFKLWNRRPAPENKPLTLEHVDCKTCLFEDRLADEEPCRHCKGAYPSRYARKPEQEAQHE